MSNTKDTIEEIKNDIKSLVHNIAKLKGESGSMWSESFSEFKNLLSIAANDSKSQIPAGKLIYKCINCIYGDTFKKAFVAVGIAGIALYLLKKD